MRKYTLTLTDELDAKLSRLAHAESVSRSEVGRGGLDQLFERMGASSEDVPPLPHSQIVRKQSPFAGA